MPVCPEKLDILGIYMHDVMENLREKVVGEEFDYLLLHNLLQNYAKPRDKISALLKKNGIIRVKKGLYVFGPKYRRRPLSVEVLANLIYGPSYISKEYALSFYGLIPEKVELITSMSLKKNKLFQTPVGTFSYSCIPLKKFSVGVTLYAQEAYPAFFIATKEKALCDLLAKENDIHTCDELFEHLTENLRIEAQEIFHLRKEELEAIQAHYQNKTTNILVQLCTKKK